MSIKNIIHYALIFIVLAIFAHNFNGYTTVCNDQINTDYSADTDNFTISLDTEAYILIWPSYDYGFKYGVMGKGKMYEFDIPDPDLFAAEGVWSHICVYKYADSEGTYSFVETGLKRYKINWSVWISTYNKLYYAFRTRNGYTASIEVGDAELNTVYGFKIVYVTNGKWMIVIKKLYSDELICTRIVDVGLYYGGYVYSQIESTTGTLPSSNQNLFYWYNIRYQADIVNGSHIIDGSMDMKILILLMM